MLQGSTPRTVVDGSRAWVSGAFAPGITPVRVAYILPYSSGSLVLSQTFPADFDQLLDEARQELEANHRRDVGRIAAGQQTQAKR